MKRHILLITIICSLVLGMGPVFLNGQAAQPEVSLDDHPNGPPLRGPMVPPYMSAEDEFGLGLPASASGFVGPSPSLLVGPFFDSDVLVPGPALLNRFAPAPIWPPVQPPQSSPYYMDAVSCDHSSMPACPGGLFVRFSVDRATGGATPADASYQQAMNNEQPADIFRTTQPYTHVGNFVPLAPMPAPYGGLLPPAGTGGSNQLQYDHFGTFGFLPVPPCPPITPGSHDNVDAFNEWPVSILNTNIYFCLHPADAILRGLSPADILISPNPPGGLTWPAAVFAAAAQMGLDTFGFATDSIDGLALWDNGVPGVLEPGIDYAAFTLAPGSATLTNIGGLTAGDVFLTDFQGNFYTWLLASDMGVGNLPNPPLPVIRASEINVDALDLTIDPEPSSYINPITNPITAPGIKN